MAGQMYRGLELRIVARPGANVWRWEVQLDRGLRYGNVSGPRDLAISGCQDLH